jgi:hypothetical protein
MFTRLNKPVPIRGLVSTIPPISSPAASKSRKSNSEKQRGPNTLNWIYVDPRTLEVRYAPHAHELLSKGHILGPWHWTSEGEDGSGLMVKGWEGFVAVEEEEGGEWMVYYDKDDDLLRDREMVGARRVLRISLERKLVDDDEEPIDCIEGATTEIVEWEIEEVED